MSAQARLRDQLLASPSLIRWRPARDLAAHMLLFIDDSERCSAIAVEWIRRGLGCSRVDTGLGRVSGSTYLPGYAESREPDVPTYAGSTVNNTVHAMQLMWLSDGPVVFRDVAGDSRFDMTLHDMLADAGTVSKMGAAVGPRERAVGLICADWVGREIPFSSALYERYESLVCDVLGPILAESHTLQRLRPAPPAWDEPAVARARSSLTAAELKVALLAASGLPYKLIADRLNKSSATVDHQLRSIRRKLNVRTHAELAAVLASIDEWGSSRTPRT